jgi:hypothetical protein
VIFQSRIYFISVRPSHVNSRFGSRGRGRDARLGDGRKSCERRSYGTVQHTLSLTRTYIRTYVRSLGVCTVRKERPRRQSACTHTARFPATDRSRSRGIFGCCFRVLGFLSRSIFKIIKYIRLSSLQTTTTTTTTKGHYHRQLDPVLSTLH